LEGSGPQISKLRPATKMGPTSQFFQFFHPKCTKIDDKLYNDPFRNTIWEMEKDDGCKASTFQELASMGVIYFKNLFKSSDQANITKIIKVVELFPCFVDQDINDNLFVEVTREEIKVIFSF
jgi:hypothetical protein